VGRAFLPLLLLCGTAVADLIDLGGTEAELCGRFNAGKERVRFLAVVSPG
jgi:hypothetical protein